MKMIYSKDPPFRNSFHWFLICKYTFSTQGICTMVLETLQPKVSSCYILHSLHFVPLLFFDMFCCTDEISIVVLGSVEKFISPGTNFDFVSRGIRFLGSSLSHLVFKKHEFFLINS